jgi:hypothetical protein
VDRLRWLAALLVATLGLALLGPAGAAAARGLPVAAASAAFDPFEAEEEEGELEGEEEAGEEEAGDEADEPDECEFANEALEEACEEKLEEEELEEAEAEECRLESAEATVAAVPGRNQVRLSVRYRTFEPSAVEIALGLHGGRGSLALGTETARFGHSGIFHSTQTLTNAQMAEAMAAREFTVSVHALNTPGFCGELFERHLTARKGAGAGLQWSDPTAARRAKASRAH